MITQFAYLAALVLSIGGLALLDRRFGLAFWYDARRAGLIIAIATVVYVIWDIAGIAGGIFLHGNSPYTLPLRLGPEFPLEEIVFLVLLSYSALILWRAGEKRWPST